MRISTRIIIGYGIILIFFGVVTYVNFRLSENVNDNTNFLRGSEMIIRNAAQLQRGIIDMENSFRGYLLTGNESFLEPYTEGLRTVPQLFSELKSNLPRAGFRIGKLDSIEFLYSQWQNQFASSMIQAKRNSLLSPTADFQYNKLIESDIDNKVGKNITDVIRTKFKQFNDFEYQNRSERQQKLNQSIISTQTISFILIVTSFLLSLVSALFITRFIIRRIRLMVDAAERISQGDLKVRISETQRDELTSLSQSLNTMAIKLDDSFTDLERKNSDLNQFAYIVSHDLKAPLRGIENVMNWIREDVGDELTPQIKEYHELIKGRVKRMENLINGILEFSRIGRTKKPVERVDVKELLDEIIESIAPPDKFSINIQENMPVLLTEKILLYQVFSNLISNAVKYHDKEIGNIDIGYKEKGRFFEFFVRDDGPGIEKEYHDKIFVIFQTLKERDAFESTGVGLAIVKKVIEEKGGTIQLDSEPGKGSTFYFTWPKFGEAEG